MTKQESIKQNKDGELEVKYIPFEEFWANRTQSERDALIRDFGPLDKPFPVQIRKKEKRK